MGTATRTPPSSPAASASTATPPRSWPCTIRWRRPTSAWPTCWARRRRCMGRSTGPCRGSGAGGADMGSIELVCPAGSPAMLKAAVEAGADSVYCGLRDDTNARNLPGLNFSPAELADSVRWAHARGAKVLLAVNTFARAGASSRWRHSIDAAAAAGVDAVIVADLGVLACAREAHPNLRLHLSVQAAAGSPEAIAFYARTYGVKRVVLPRVLSVEEIAALNREIEVETEAFVYGGLCVMAEGRCALSSYATGRSPNLDGVCSPPEAVSYTEEAGAMVSRLGGLALDRYAPGEPAGYPT